VQTVRVLYHSEQDGWWAESPDFPGYTAFGATFEEVREHVLEGIPQLASENNLEDPSIVEFMPTLRSGNPLTKGYGFSIEVTERFRKTLADLSDRKKTGELLSQ
jgi:predicted RNase H-like HicB family nuclease